MKIRTEYVFPPIPNRNFDWSAYDDDTYDGTGSKIGQGPTEAAAIADLLEQIGQLDDLPRPRTTCAFCGEVPDKCGCPYQV